LHLSQTVVDKLINKFILLLDSVYTLLVVDFCENETITNDKICKIFGIPGVSKLDTHLLLLHTVINATRLFNFYLTIESKYISACKKKLLSP